MVAPVQHSNLAQQSYRYSVDETDMIDFVDRWWLAFAAENNAAGLTAVSVVGRPIWDFITDAATQRLYREIHQRVRSTGRSIEVPFRCDSPTLKRYMELTIVAKESGGLLYESKLVRASPHRRLTTLSPGSKRTKAFLTMCSCCKRSLIEPSGWLEMEEISLRLRLYDQEAVPDLRYTLCPDCSSQVLGHGI